MFQKKFFSSIIFLFLKHLNLTWCCHQFKALCKTKLVTIFSLWNSQLDKFSG